MLGLDEKEETNEEARAKMMVKRAAWVTPNAGGDKPTISTCIGRWILYPREAPLGPMILCQNDRSFCSLITEELSTC